MKKCARPARAWSRRKQPLERFHLTRNSFLGAVENTATLIYDKLDFDLIIRSKNYLHLSDPGTSI